MGKKFWGVDIQKEIGDAIKQTDMPNFLFVSRGAVTENSVLSGPGDRATDVQFTVWGGFAQFSDMELRELPNNVTGFRKIALIGAAFAAAGVKPKALDRVVDTDRTYTVTRVLTTSAEASWMLALR